MAEEYPDIPLEHSAGLGSGPAPRPSDRDLLDYYLGPTGIPDRVRSANQLLNPIAALEELGAQSAAAADPNLSPEDRRRAALAAALGTGLLAIPAARPLAKSLPAFRSIDDDAGRAVVETLTGASPDLADPARRQLLAGLGATAMLPGEGLFRATPPVREVSEQEADDLGAYLSAVSQGSPDVVLRAGVGDNGGPPLQDPARLSTGLYSPSLRAVQNLPQERGTYQQLRAQILKGGGKEEEIRFAGLDRMFASDESVTRQQLQEALQGRVDMVQLVEDRATGVLGDFADPNDSSQQEEMLGSFVDRNIDDYRERLLTEVLPESFESNSRPLRDVYDESVRQSQLTEEPNSILARMTGVSEIETGQRNVDALQAAIEQRGYTSIDDYLEDNPNARVDTFDGGLYDSVDDYRERGYDVDEEVYRGLEEDFFRMSPDERAEAAGYGFSFQPGDTQYARYMTPGLVDYRERRYAFTDPGGVTAPGELRGIPSGHFDRDETRNFVHTRSALGYTPGAGNPNTYVLGEVQSDTAQGLRNAYSQLPEETLEDRAVMAAASPLPGDITPEDWRQMQRMPDDYLPGLRGNVVEQLTFDPERPLTLEDFQSAVSLTQGVKRNRLAEADQRLRQELFVNTPERLAEQLNTGAIDQQTYDSIRPIVEEEFRRRMRDFENFARDPENTYELLTGTFIPDEVRDRIRRGEWLSEDEIQGLYSDGERAPVAVDLMQTLAQRGVNPDTYQALIASSRLLNRNTRSPQPYVGSTNRWVDFALKSELVNAANESVPYFAISNPDMVRRATYGSEEGQGEFYGRIVPLRLQNVLRRLDKDIVTAMDPDEARRLRSEGQVVLGPMSLETASGTESVIGINMTPELRRRILGEEGPGLSSYAKGGIVSLFANRA